MKSMLCVLSVGLTIGAMGAAAEVKPAPIHYKTGQSPSYTNTHLDMHQTQQRNVGEPRNLIAHLDGAEEPFVSYGLTEPFLLGEEAETYRPARYAPEPQLVAAPIPDPVTRAPVAKRSPVAKQVAMASSADAYEIQIGSYTKFSNANTMMSKYTAIAPARIAHATVKGRDFYRVMLAGGHTRSAAERKLVALNRMGVDGFIVTKK